MKLQEFFLDLPPPPPGYPIRKKSCQGILWSWHEVLPESNMAEAKLVLRSGEIFVFKNENNGASSKTMKDLISSVRYIQSKVNEKLTEIVNDEKASGTTKDLKGLSVCRVWHVCGDCIWIYSSI